MNLNIWRDFQICISVPLRLQLRKNLNINSPSNKISDLSVFWHDLQLEYLVVSETKLDSSFLSAQFLLENHEIREWRDKEGHEEGLLSL